MWVITFDLHSDKANDIGAYGKIMTRMVRNNFVPKQKSVYATHYGIDCLLRALDDVKAIPDIKDCINKFMISEMTDGYDIADFMRDTK